MLNAASSNSKSKQQSFCEREVRRKKISQESGEAAAGLGKTEEQILKKSQKHLELLGIKNPQEQQIFISQITSFASAMIDNYLATKDAN